MNVFVTPNMRRFSSFSDLEEYEKSISFMGVDKTPLSVIDLMELKMLMIIAEPGFGKTRLLQEIILQSKSKQKKAICINLKKVSGDLCEYIARNTQIAEHIDENVEGEDLLISEAFPLENNESILVCLDALDEVQASNVSTIIDGIKALIKTYPSVSLYVSCRRNYYTQYADLLDRIPFAFINLDVFSVDQVEEYLVNANILKSKIELIKKKLQITDRHLIIQVPRYLKMLPIILNKTKDIDIDKMKKSDIFKEFTYFKLEVENKKKTGELSQKRELIIRILGKIALIMEIHQSNVLKKDDLMTLFDDIKSNLCMSFLNQVDILDLYERSLLRDNFDGTIQFENTEIQEYLAAVEISRLGHIHQVVFDLAIAPELLEIYPSWYNALSFLVEIDPRIVSSLAQLGQRKQYKLQGREYHKLITSVPELLSGEDTTLLFKQVFEYYQINSQILDLGIAENLARFSIEDVKTTINIVGTLGVQKANISRLAGYRGEHNPNEKNFWTEVLLDFAKDDDNQIADIIFALGKMGNIEILSQIAKPLLSKSKELTQIIISACYIANPNHDFAIEAFIEGTKQDEIMARYGFYDLTDARAIKRVFDYLITDAEFRNKFLEDETVFGSKDNILIKNIEAIWDTDIENRIIKLIVSILSDDKQWYAEKSKFIESILLLAKEHNTEIIFEVVDSLISTEHINNTINNWYYWPQFLRLLLCKGQVMQLLDQLTEQKEGKQIVFRILQYMALLNTDNATEIYNEGHPYFVQEYKEFEKKPKSSKKKNDNNDKIYRNFKFKLGPEPGKYMSDVFSYFLQNKDILTPFLSAEDYERLKKIIKGSVFEISNFKNFTLTINEQSENSRKYTTSSLVDPFKICLKICAEYNEFLQIDFGEYKENIVNYIPFSDSEGLEIIFKIIPELTEEDIKGLSEVYSDSRKDDLAYFAPRNFSATCNRYKIQAIPVLMKLITDEKIDIYTRQDVLKTLVDLSNDKKIIQDVFDRYNNDAAAPAFRLAEIANASLIQYYGNKDDILWRVTELIGRKFPLIRENEAGFIDSKVHELREKRFASPIMNLRDSRYEELILNLANEAFNVYDLGVEFQAYGIYLWEIVCDYYYNLRETKSYRYLLNLIKQVETKYDQHQAYLEFSFYFNKLQFHYLQYLGKPQDFPTCIKIYNVLKEKQYIDIISPRELLELVSSVLDEDVRNWIEAEGAYRFIQEHTGKQEDLIQKTIKTQIENGLLRRGVRRPEIRREEQLLDDKRPDMLISYGFVGPILIEIKRVDNSEVYDEKAREDYKTKFLQYMAATGAYFGLFLIFKINNKYDMDKFYPEVVSLYGDCENVFVEKYDCIKGLAKGASRATKKSPKS